MIQISKILKKVPIFQMLSKENIDFIVERLKFKTFAANETICKIGDPGDEMYIVISGKVKICIYGSEEEEQIVATLNPGDYFGEMALLTGEPRSASVIAMEDSETFMLHKNDFDVILEKFPSISLSMGKIVSKRLRDTLQKATSMPAQKIEAAQGGPSGSLADVPLEDLISFCEGNSITGNMLITHADQKGVFEFETGRMKSIVLGDKKDDQALDEMLSWKEGKFEINLRPLEIKKESSRPEAAPEETKSILVTNNSLVVRKIIERAFKGLGYEVHMARNIAESLDLMENNKTDIVISDIKLPDGDGREFIEKTREKRAVPFIFITDKSVNPDFESSLQKMGSAEITKTHEVSEIVKLVENMI